MTLITGSGTGVTVGQPAVGIQRYGLFSAANGPLPMPPHGSISGITYEMEHCGDGDLWPPAQCVNPGNSKAFATCDAIASGQPFTILGSWQVGAIGHSEEEMKRRAVIRLTDNSQFLVEKAFWGGRTAAPVMADALTTTGLIAGHGDVTPTPGTPVPLEQGIALLEQAVAQYPYRATLHAQPLVSPYATERLLCVPDGKPGAPGTKYWTPMGNQWSFGRGYGGGLPGVGTAPPGPIAPALQTAYIVATGPVTLWRDPEINVSPPYRAMDRSANQVYVLAEQSWAIAIDCVIWFVLVNLVGM